MRVDDFDFELPDAAIALRPASPRDSARLLEVKPQPDGRATLGDRVVRDLPRLLRRGDALVVNDTRVVPARLFGVRRRQDSEARLDITLHKRTSDQVWAAFVRPAKRLAAGDRVIFGNPEGAAPLLAAEVLARDAGEVILRFDRGGRDLDHALDAVGRPPLPPYIAARRAEDAADSADYQTMFARHPGAVAAPTAGLHFTPRLMADLAEAGVSLHKVTLHVGAGTFLPVKSETTEQHLMHAEDGEVGAEVADELNAVRERGGRIVAVGTTSLRILESASAESDEVQAFSGETSIFITPGYRFRVVDALVTNFHLPRSTLFMLVGAFSGLSNMKAAYAHAIEAGYRFYSYGDANLLWRVPTPNAEAT